MRSILSGSLLSLLLLAGACKKGKIQEVSNGLPGTWTEQQSSLATQSRSLMFGRDSIYFITWDRTSPQVTLVNYVSGTYGVDGDKLITHFKEVLIRQDNDKVIYRAPFSGNLFDNATFLLNGNQLVLHYTSYPADAPIATTMVLNRQLPD